MERIALVTGANRGLGLATARALAAADYRVLITSRDQERAEQAAAELARDGLQVEPWQLDVADAASVDRLAGGVLAKHGRLDVLVNNAGIQLDPLGFVDPVGSSLFNTDVALIEQTLATNFYGALRMLQAFVPGMRERSFGRVVNVSSMLGSLEHMGGLMPGYRTSKTALNALTKMAAGELKEHNVLVNSVCPGWVQTDLGGENAEKTPAEGAEIVVWAATLPDDGPRGGFFRDGQPFPF